MNSEAFRKVSGRAVLLRFGGFCKWLKDYDDVLNVDVADIEVETVGPIMLDEMQRMYAETAQSRFPIPWHYGTLVTRATIAFDWEPFLMAAALEPIKFGKILDTFGTATLSVMKGWVKIKDTELIVIHDDIASTKGVILSPAWYREYVFPWYKQFFDVVHQGGKKVLYVSDGNYIDVLDDLLETEPDGLYIESTSLDPETLMRAAGKDKLYMLKFNSRIMDLGTPEDVYAELKTIRKLHEEFPGIMISPGGEKRIPENEQAFWKYYDELLVYEK